MLRIKQFFALAGLTAVEAIRQPICILLTTACLLAIGATPLMLMHSFGEDGKLVRDSGLAFHFVFGLFIAGYAASTSLTREVSSGTVAAVLSKPVGRTTLFFSKFTGVCAVTLLFSACAGLATLLAERVAEHFVYSPHLVGYIVDWQTGRLLVASPFAALGLAGIINYRTRRPFQSTAFGLLLVSLLLVTFIAAFFERNGSPGPFDVRLLWRIVPASILITLALLVLSAAAISLSTRLSTTPTLTVCAAIFLVGLMSDYLLGRHAETSVVAAVLFRLLPNWQHFWLSDALNAGGRIPWVYLLNAAGYAALYAGGVLAVGALSFKHAEVA